MIMWMLWSIGFAALIFAGALAAERVAGVFAVARRHVWMVAIVAAAVVPPILATQAPSEFAPAIVLVEEFPDGPVPADGSPRTFVRPAIVHAPISRERVTSRGDAGGNRAAIALWALASVLVGLVFARTMLRLRRDSASWPEITVGEYRALLAPNAGPAVVGFTRPRIVLPEWALTLETELRELMLCHEAEHIRARDPRTVMIAGALLVMFPWNAMMWLIVRQLRRAMELDCDARVIRAVGNATAYGRVLLTVGERFTAPVPLGAPLAAPRPLLEQRIHAMTAPRPRRPLRVALPFIALALLVTTAAVRAPRPASLGPIALGSPAITRSPVRNTVRRQSPAPTSTRAASRKADLRRAIADTALAPQVVPIPAVASPVAFDRAFALATARTNFPAVMRGDVNATSLVLVFDSEGQFVRGFPVVGSIMIAIGGDTLSATQRMALQRAAASNGTSGSRGAGRGGRGGGGTGAAPSSGGRTSYMVGFGMTSRRDSLGNSHPGPVNESPGLTTIPISGDVSGIAGIPSSRITNVDQFSLNDRDGMNSRFDLLAVHLTASGDTVSMETRGRPNVAMYEFAVHKDTGAAGTCDGQASGISKPLSYQGLTQNISCLQESQKKKATVKQLVIIPMPIPDLARPFEMRACYEVVPNGKSKLLEWTKSRDTGYNLKIEESLKKYEFNPATLNGVAVIDTACVRAVTPPKSGQ